MQIGSAVFLALLISKIYTHWHTQSCANRLPLISFSISSFCKESFRRRLYESESISSYEAFTMHSELLRRVQ